MAISYVGSNGKGFLNNAGSLTFTTTRTIQAGEHVVIFEHSAGGGALPTGVTVGSLSLSNDALSNVQTNISIWSARATAQIASGSTVSITYSVNPTNQHAICFSLSGIASASYVDKTKANNFTSSSTPSTGASDTTTQADEIVISGVSWGDGSSTAAPDGSYTEIDEINDSTGVHSSECAYRIVSSTGAQTASWTLSTGSYGDCLLVTYKSGLVLDNCLPDADVTTTGWSTAPLYSKINDASDATVITATAS